MQLKRVVVTGLGALTPIGNTIEEYWNALANGVSGAAPISHFDASKSKTRFACEVKNFNPTDFINRKEARKMDKFTQYAMVASDEAIADANLDLETINKLRVGVIWGAGIGGLETLQNEVLNYAAGDGTPRFNPFFYSQNDSRYCTREYLYKKWFHGTKLHHCFCLCFFCQCNDRRVELYSIRVL